MAELDDKKAQFVSNIRVWMQDYKAIMERAWTLQNNWPFYLAILTEEDLPDAIVASGDPATKMQSLTDAVANIQTIHTAFDAGIDDNFERVV